MRLLNWRFDNLRGDIFGGVTAGIVALPLALAFGVQSGMGAIAGIYGAIALGVFAAAFGGTGAQISGPTGPMTVVSTVVVLTAIEKFGSLEKGLGFIVAIFIFSGIIQIVCGLLRLGSYIRYVPYPVVSGFMSGIGVIIILLQIFPFFGQPSPKKIIDVVTHIVDLVPKINWGAALIASGTIAIIYLFPKISKTIPSTLAALIFMTILSIIADLNIPIIDKIPVGFPELKLYSLSMFDFDYVIIAIELAVTLALLGILDSLLTSVIVDNITKTKHDSNRELIGQGIGNIFGGSIAGLPGAGATMRSLVNVNAGGKTPISGVLHGLLLLFVLLGLGKYARLIPLPVLAGILITVGIGIIDYKGMRHITSVPKSDASILIIVLGLTVFVDLIQAVAAGVILSCVLFMKAMSDHLEKVVKIVPLNDFVKEMPWADENIPKKVAEKIFVKHLDGPLFFGFAPGFQNLAANLPKIIQVVILKMRYVPTIDQTGLYALEETVRTLEGRGIAVVLVDLQPQPLRMLRRIDLIPGLIPESYVFKSFDNCLKWLKGKLQIAQGNDEVFFEELRKKQKYRLTPKYRL